MFMLTLQVVWKMYRKQILLVGSLALAFGLGYGIARYSLPAKVVVKTDTVVQWRDKVVEKEVVKTQTVYVTDKKERIQRKTTEITKPDGSKTKVTEENIGTDTTAKGSDTSTADRSKVQDSSGESKQAASKLIEYNKAEWMAGMTIGADFQSLRSFDPKKSVIYGVEVQKRVVGPVWGGLWVNSKQQFGLSVKMEF